MPEKVHRALERSAKKKGLTGKRKDRYVYGTLSKIARGTTGAVKKKKTKPRKKVRSSHTGRRG